MSRATNPASSGPAGPHFEGQVAANYMLSMLVGAEPRGLPGTTFDRVQLQRGSEGFPLDDVIVHAHSTSGAEAIIEVQVKRSITFAPTDKVFEKVVAQIARSSESEGFWDRNHQLCIAISQTSRKISGSYQDLLKWARELGSGTEFFKRIDRKYSGNDFMREFVKTFQENLQKAEASHSDEDVWQLLRRIQIHVYDFTATGSASEELARERSARALHSEDTPKAGILWKYLVELAIETAAVGGERSRVQLVENLGAESFRLAGDSRFKTARDHLGESTHQALSDISDSILTISINRQDRVDNIREIIDGCRFLEIRGEAGVGKSGLLKHFAQMAGLEGRCIFLSPNRTIPRGWVAMRQAIEFPGTAKELLQDLAADGGGYLFIDNLDFFSDEEKATVKDLVREAASVPGMIVIATARARPSAEHVDWLPIDVLNQLGRGEPFVVDELSDSEVDELRHADPRLGSLLAEEHPAKAVTRNLFRLARLAALPASHNSLRSEVEMANQWWTSADGETDGRRDRFRLLRKLAVISLGREQLLDVSGDPPNAIDALILSGTLRDLENDNVAFKHDVLKEWAIAQHIILTPNDLISLDLKRPAPPELARGLELASRIALETNRDVELWNVLLTIVSKVEHHKSWRRVVILGVVHSEVAGELLPLIETALFADEGLLLCELLRLVMAVDVQPAQAFLEKVGIKIETPVQGVYFPRGSSWVRLLVWLLATEPEIPRKSIPDVVEFFNHWCLLGGLIKDDPLTQSILALFQHWLINLEVAYESATWRERHQVFDGILTSDELDRLEEKIHTTFIMLANRVPNLAREYLKTVQNKRHKDRIYSKLLKFRGTLTQAAPAELAAITLETLVEPKPKAAEWDGGYRHRRALTHLDSQFYPASPAQGPFYDLLIHATEHGLWLIRSLIQAVVNFHTDDSGDPDAFILEFPGGAKHYTWTQTYGWSRSSNYGSVTSALMALEYWGHERVDRGENVTDIVNDILGDGETSAAFLLPVVDILISHWPKTNSVAVPFVANPELLVADHSRPRRDAHQDTFNFPDFFGIGALMKEPLGPKLESLKGRISRRYSLCDFLQNYANDGDVDLSAKVRELLVNATSSLGAIEDTDNLRCPRFMAHYALNLLNADNYRDIEVERDSGEKVTVRQYVPPKEEAAHFARIQGDSLEKSRDAEIALFIDQLIDNSNSSSTELAGKLLDWAKSKKSKELFFDRTNSLGLDQAIVGAAFIAMRDGIPDVTQDDRDWINSVFDQVDKINPDDVTAMREGVRFNPVAMAFAGRIFSMCGVLNLETFRKLLETAAFHAAAAHGTGVAATALAAVDDRLPRSLLRVAFAAAIHPTNHWDKPEAVKVKAEEIYQNRLRQAVEVEMEWLTSGGTEPSWPQFPTDGVERRKRPNIRVRKNIDSSEDEDIDDEIPELPSVFVDHQAAALWLRCVISSISNVSPTLLRDILDNYSGWTFLSNGINLSEGEKISEPPREWNNAVFRLMSQESLVCNSTEAEKMIARITSLPDDSFLEITRIFLRAFDEAYFNHSLKDVEIAVKVRDLLAQRLMKTRVWVYLRGTKSDGIEHRLGPAGATFFFNDLPFGQAPKCYLFENAAINSLPFLPVLYNLANTAPSPFVAMVFLNWLEVSPSIDHVDAIVSFSAAALVFYPESRDFWIDIGTGRRICKLLEILLPDLRTKITEDTVVGAEVERILGLLVAIGVSEAKVLEKSLMESS